MFFSPRIQLKSLIGLCRRLGMSLEAGIDLRSALQREAQAASGQLRRHLLEVRDAISRGETLSEALAGCGDFFPAVFREMVEVGEQSGELDAVLNQLAEYDQARLNMRRTFLASIIWPLTQFGFALAVVGFLIWIMGFLGGADVLGLGLVGNRGLAIYATFLAVAGALLWFVCRAASRGLIWTRPIQRLALRLPLLGKPLQTMALARIAWSLHLTMNTGMNVRRAMELSIRSAQNARYTDTLPLVEAAIANGSSIHEAFDRAGGYPVEFLDTLAVGEQSGKVVDSMGRLARQYQDRARMALAAMAVAAGWAVWALVAMLMVALIFRISSIYLNAIRGAIGP
jgi:type IV pilus assembly protein PilC